MHRYSLNGFAHHVHRGTVSLINPLSVGPRLAQGTVHRVGVLHHNGTYQNSFTILYFSPGVTALHRVNRVVQATGSAAK